MTADRSTAMIIRRGRRVADYLHAHRTALFVHLTAEASLLPAKEPEAVEKHLRFARGLQIETRIVGGSDIAKTVVEFARRHRVTQIFVAHSQTRLIERLRGRIPRRALSARRTPSSHGRLRPQSQMRLIVAFGRTTYPRVSFDGNGKNPAREGCRPSKFASL